MHTRMRPAHTRPLAALLVAAAGMTFQGGLMAAPVQGADAAQVQPAARFYANLLGKTAAVPVVNAPAVDLQEVAREDQERQTAGLAPRFAITNSVTMTPATDGLWEEVEGHTLVWRLRVASPGALSLNLGFGRYHMPQGGRLFIYASDFSQIIRPFTATDNAEHGQLWTPVVLSDQIVVEVTIPARAVGGLILELTSINVGYRGFGQPPTKRSGACNIDVVCPEGDDWWDEIPSVGVISLGGGTFCTGFMLNNTAQDQTPYFQTAYHCGIRSGNAASLVVYWNYETSICDGTPDGQLNKFQTGAFWRAGYSTSDFTLVELDEDPDPDWEVTFAGWDRSGADASMAVAIHHPNTDEKRISFEYAPTTTTSYYETSVPGDGTHVRVTDWDLGTTEPGSSGSPLFNQDHQVIGQLHGGDAACGNDLSDWYGKFSASWTGGGSSSSRLMDWLDSGNTGATSVDTLAPGASGLKVTPLTGLDSQGPMGGPFTTDSIVYTLENRNDTGLGFSVTKSEPWVSISSTGGTLPAHATTQITVSIDASAATFATGFYQDTVYFTNTTDHDGDTSRPVSLAVGTPSVHHSWNMDTDPGWTTEGLWAWGQPVGSGGQYGNPDPSSGYTGGNVYGYNLYGDYQNGLPETHLTTTAIDCSGLLRVKVTFHRWLGVEQSAYDHAFLRVSNDGNNWTRVWNNIAEVTDGAWTYQEFDIYETADGQPTVYLRWTMGPTDASWQYCGWNIDDVEIWAISQAQTECGNGIVETGESCDTGILPGQPGACPTDCDTGDPCSIDALVDPGTCLAHCDSVVIANPIHSDGCCPVAANAISDNDCDPVCGNDVCEDGETVLNCSADCQCGDDSDCDDRYVCTADRCVGGVCAYVPHGYRYGDVLHDGTINVFDIFCVLNGFSAQFPDCSFEDIDIEPCSGNGAVNILDLFAVLNALGGTDPCCSIP